MLIEQKLLTKLQPHADRIKNGVCDDFDYLPAVLLQIIQGQKQQLQLSDEKFATVASKFSETEVSISTVKAAAEQMGLQSQDHVARAVVAANERLDAIFQKIAGVEASVATLVTESQKNHLKSQRLIISCLVATAIAICFGVALFVRH